MKILSYNVNGLGNLFRRGKVKEIIMKANLDVVMLHETQVMEVDSFLIKSIQPQDSGLGSSSLQMVLQEGI